jgi:CMP-N,N'-diacetyllegionaminic acid synthase
MFMDNTILGLVPARGGSKGLPGKNIKEIMGKPLIAYTIEEALKSSCIDRVVVSTEDDKIARISKDFGAEVPFKRPSAFATDEASSIDVVLHALRFLQKQGPLTDSIMLLQPTSPLRSREDIDRAIELFYKSRADTLVSVHSMAHHPFNCLAVDGDYWNYLVKPPPNVTRRQEYKQRYYCINGAIYLSRVEFFLEHRTFVVEGRTILYIMDPRNGIDIDDIDDFHLAENLLR